MDKKRKKGPEHISDILREASKEWTKSMVKKAMDSERFRNMEELTKDLPVQLAFIYIEGDPNYIRMINLN